MYCFKHVIKNYLITTLLSMCAVAIMEPAYGCVGIENVFNINLGSKTDEGVIVQLSWREVEFGAPAEKKTELEVLDDDGFLSYYLAYVKLVSDKQTTSEISGKDLMVMSTLQKNANHLKAYITAHPSMLSGSGEEKAARQRILEAIERLEKIANTSSPALPVKVSELSAINRDLRYYSSWAAYKTRKKGQPSWNDPVPFTKIELPKVKPVEDLRCSSSISVFNDGYPQVKSARGIASDSK